MVHLVATLANDADHMPSLLYALRNEVVLPEKAAPGEVWGVGYYAEDRALIIRKPAELLTARTVFELAPNVQSSTVLACVKREAKAVEQAPPHRFRSWLFGFSGDLAPLTPLTSRIVDKLPDFVLHEIGDSAGGSLAFGMFVTELHRTGLLADTLATHQAFAQAMQRTVEAVRMLATEAGVAAPSASYVATNGRVVIASRAGAPLFVKTQEGLESSPYGPTDPSLSEFKRLAEALKRFRAIILTQEVAAGRAERSSAERSDAGPARAREGVFEAGRTGWTEVQEGSTIFFDRKLTMQKL
jgi:hypothetical protein